MSTPIRIRRVETLPTDQPLRDFDELAESVQDRLVDVVRNGRANAVIEDDDSAEVCGIVRFTSYYAVELA